MPRLVNRPPRLRRHKRGYGVVTLGNKDHYMGAWPNRGKAPKAVQEAYRRFLAEHWAQDGAPPPPRKEEATIEDLIAQFWSWAKRYYRKNGEPTSEVGNIAAALRPLRKLYGTTPACDFGPVKLQAVRDHIMRTEDLTRGTLNKHIGRIKRMFRWAKNNEVIPGRVYDFIRDVEGLRKGRTDLRESQPVQPVSDDVVEATLSFLPATVADMVRFQRLTGCRPGEVCTIRPCDVDRSSGDVWVYRPEGHKAEHYEKDRVIFIGPKASPVKVHS